MRQFAKTFFTIVIPSALAGGLIFGSAFGRADAGRTSDASLAGAWKIGDGGVLVAERAPKPPKPPRAPAPPPPPGGDEWDVDVDTDAIPPVPAVPPVPAIPGVPAVPAVPPVPGMHAHGKHGKHGGGGFHLNGSIGGPGFSVSIHDGKVEISGLDQLIDSKLDEARAQIERDQSIPPDVRAKVLGRLDRSRAVIKRRVGSLHGADLSQLQDEMEKMGEELAKEMEGLGADLDKNLGKDLAKKFDRDWTKNFKNWKPGTQWNFQTPDADDHDADADDGNDDSDADDNDGSDVPTPDVADAADLASAMADLHDLGLKPAQRAEIARIGAESEKAVAAAQERLEQLSSQLHDKLASPAANEAEVGAYIDQITAQESAIRKARILGWVKARHVLDDQQRARVEKRRK